MFKRARSHRVRLFLMKWLQFLNRINYIPSLIFFIMRKSESRNLVELISEHVRDMEMERLQLM